MRQPSLSASSVLAYSNLSIGLLSGRPCLIAAYVQSLVIILTTYFVAAV